MVGKLEFRNLRVLLTGSNPFGLQLLRAALNLVEVRDIVVAGDPEAALRCLRTERFSALICDGEPEPLGHVPFLLAARRADGVLNPMLPVFLVSETPRHRLVARVRDLGANAVLARPVSAAAIARRLTAAIVSPRPFIVAPDYFGPDRRMRDRGNRHGEERRHRNARRIAVTVPRPLPHL